MQWKPISPDLTSGCTGAAPERRTRLLHLRAIGVGGGNAVYAGTDDGLVYVSPDAHDTDTRPGRGWTRRRCPNRPVTQIAVDRSNYRIAYVAYNGFNAATPSRPGHVFKTTDGGENWTDISGNLPDCPVNSLILDPSYPNTLYAGTDVGPFVTYDGGVALGAARHRLPDVAIWQLDLDPPTAMLAAGHPRPRRVPDLPTRRRPGARRLQGRRGHPGRPRRATLDYTHHR